MRIQHARLTLTLLACSAVLWSLAKLASAEDALAPFFQTPAEFANQRLEGRDPLKFDQGAPVRNAVEWSRRRRQIRDQWHALLGPWPPLVDRPRLEIVETQRRENLTQHRIRVQVAARQMLDGYLLVPAGKGPFPAVVVPYYDPETSVGLKGELRDFAWQLSRRGFVSLSIGSPGGDARKPDLDGATCQPLSYLGYIAANCYNALATRDDVDPRRVGIVGHSYGGKWSLFGSCLFDKFACAAWSDPGIVFDEARGSVNYWEPWYLGLDAARTRKPGLISAESPRTGPYARLIDERRNLHELHTLMAPRPLLVSGGSEDFPSRWTAFNHSVAVNELLGFTHRVGMTNRPLHAPTEESNAQIYAFFEATLKTARREVAPIAHRGLLRDAPENTLVNFTACLDAHCGFEFDVRRTRDGVLVCLHDDTLDRTTDGTGPVTARTLAEVRELDAGGWFNASFRGEKVPTIDEVLALIAAHPVSAGVYAVDLKASDASVEADVVRLAHKHGVLERLLFIGRAIENADVRHRLRAADRRAQVAAVANRRDELTGAIAAADADWVYVRFVPTSDDVLAIRAAGKHTIIAGPTVVGEETTNWSQATAAGVDAVLTDFPIEFRRSLMQSRR